LSARPVGELLKMILKLLQEVLLARNFAAQTPCREYSDGKLALNVGYNQKILAGVGARKSGFEFCFFKPILKGWTMSTAYYSCV